MQGSRQRGVDPQAALAVARQEGLSGRIGDNGHAFGPFQLNNAGGVITGRPGNTGQLQAWASSPAGIAFALDRIASVARGLQGPQAVKAIVSRFERPADPQGEISRALAAYGAPSPVPGPSAAGLPSMPSLPAGGLNPALAEILALNRQTVGLPPINLGPLTAPAGPRQTPATAPGGPSAGAVAKMPRRTGKTIRVLEHFAQPYGLTVTSTTGGRHAKNSYHYRGRAVDFGGDPNRMAALARAALQHPQDFVEAIYTGPGSTGYSILDGKVVPNSSLPAGLFDQHTNHVHLAR